MSLVAALAQAPQAPFDSPTIDWHALAPEIVLLGVISLVIVLDIVLLDRAKAMINTIAGLGLLGAMIPIVTLAADGADRSLFGGAYVVDDFALVLKGLFILSTYIVVLLSANYIADGDYWENEYYTMLLSSLLGMTLMASARDLITIFIALELLSIPAYLLATWRKHDPRSNEAGLKYYLMGVFASSIMLYGMSLIFGVSGSTVLTDIQVSLAEEESSTPIITLGIIFVVVGFAFKVSAFPFHTWAPDTYEGAPTPVTAFLAVASKAAGFVALMQLVVIGFIGRDDVFQWLFWILAAGSMTAGNVLALRQTNLIRLMAYSGVAQAGFMLAPLAVAGEGPDIANDAVSSIITYLIIYAAMTLGAFAVIIAVARKTRSGLVASYDGLFQTAPVLAVLMTVFLASLGGVPPLGGWFAKFSVFRVLTAADTTAGYVLAVIAAVNAVVAFGYYGRLAGRIWIEEPWEGDRAPITVPFAIGAALTLCAVATVVSGALPGFVTEFSDVSF